MTWILGKHRTAWLTIHAVLFILTVVAGSWIALIFLAGLLIGGWYNPPNTVPSGPKQRWFSVAVPAITLMLAVIGDNDASDLTLELSRSGFLTVKNVGHQPVKILDISFNDRADCKPKVGILSAFEFKGPADLKVGDFLILSSTCAVVRATIKTEKSSNTYHFN
jgi:hypothetical protein